MCDYSLHNVASRAAKLGDKLVVMDFAKTITRGFAGVGEPDIAVCVLPGTELAFEDHVQYHRALSPSGKARVNHKVARFRQVDLDNPHIHHDALEFPGGARAVVRFCRRPRWLEVSRCRSIEQIHAGEVLA